MIRKATIELIKTRCLRLDSAGRYPDRFIEGACDVIWQSMAYQFYENAVVDPVFYSKKYEDVTVLTDTDGNYYSDLPETILNIPRTSSGILRIDKDLNREFEFVPVSERNFTLMHSQECYQIGTKIVYYNNKDRVFYGDLMTPIIAAAGVDMLLCIPFSKFDLEEELPIPANQGASFVGAVLELIFGAMPVDLRNTNSEMV